MKSPKRSMAGLWTGLVVLAMVGTSQGADWTPLFNGRDLSGWANVNCAPKTFSVRDDMIVSTGVPTGVMRTERQYENFELELEYRHMKTGGNAGLFVWSDPITSPGVPFTRSIEVQILDGRTSETYTSHGDVFAIHGATFKPDRPHPRGAMRCLPSEHRAKPAGEWNHYRVTCSNGVVQLAVNGKVVSGGSESKPRKGYICLESEGSECHFRNIRLREWPSSNPPPDEVAPLADDFRSLYTGIDLSGWKTKAGDTASWRTNDWILENDGDAKSAKKHLWTEKVFGDFVLIADWRIPRKTERRETAVDAGQTNVPVGLLFVRGTEEPKFSISSRGGKTGEWNRHVITIRGDRITVVLNGQTVTENSVLAGIPGRGPIGLQHAGSPIQFANIFVKELK